MIANLQATGTFPELAERLWDVDPSTGNETLVARGLYRLDPSAPNGVQAFQLHPGAWHFAAGHIPKLELLGQDRPYARASNGTFSIAVSQLQLRLPVHEQPGSVPGVDAPQTPFGSCIARPRSTLSRRASHLSRGRAGDPRPGQRRVLGDRAGRRPAAEAHARARQHLPAGRRWALPVRRSPRPSHPSAPVRAADRVALAGHPALPAAPTAVDPGRALRCALAGGRQPPPPPAPHPRLAAAPAGSLTPVPRAAMGSRRPILPAS